ncbi:MAG TPA: zinc ABC transporter substrate-binding protein, partial [Bacteroidales bacterium]|nr:zinc ABC transporter substrate-binding protein [Bacteroidales bacterium]
PLPAQISSLSGSEAFIMNGQLGFEHAWMDRFRQVNPDMKVLDLSRHIKLLGPRHPSGIGVSAPPGAEPQSEGLRSEGLRSEGAGHEEGDHEDHGHAHGGPDPHYWMSPSAAFIMARDVHDFLVGLNPASSEKYDSNLYAINREISEVDSLVRVALGPGPHPTVMIYHPALAYMGRDYGFEQVSFEDEGKSPSPARMKQLIDLARENEIKIIFIQAEYDVRNAESLSRETGARLVVINPMNSDWPEAVMEIARAVGGKDFRF